MDLLWWGVVVIGVAGYLFSKGKGKQKRGSGYRGTNEHHQQKSYEKSSETIKDENTAQRQLVIVQNSEFHKRPLMNKSEFSLYCRLEALLSMSHPTFRVFAQVSLGEILGSNSKPAYWTINSKRADFVIIDRTGYPIAVVEYHGAGHFQGDAIIRDAVKREACNSAGIAFIELPARYSASDIIAIGEQLAEKVA